MRKFLATEGGQVAFALALGVVVLVWLAFHADFSGLRDTANATFSRADAFRHAAIARGDWGDVHRASRIMVMVDPVKAGLYFGLDPCRCPDPKCPAKSDEFLR